MENVVIKLQEWIVLYGLKVVAAVAILVLGWIAAGVLLIAFKPFKMVVGVSYSDDLAKVRKVLELADSSVNFAVRPWVKKADYWNVFSTTQEKIKQRFDAEGISIPFPQQDVYLHKSEENIADKTLKNNEEKHAK